MSVNKKIGFGDNFPTSINEEITTPPPPDPTVGSFNFSRTDISFDSTLRDFSET